MSTTREEHAAKEGMVRHEWAYAGQRIGRSSGKTVYCLGACRQRRRRRALGR